jgi:hypothetical protein
VNATILGALGTGVLVFLSSLLVPVISKRLNKATDAAHNAETTASSAEKISGSALKIVERLEKGLRPLRRTPRAHQRRPRIVDPGEPQHHPSTARRQRVHR